MVFVFPFWFECLAGESKHRNLVIGLRNELRALTYSKVFQVRIGNQHNLVCLCNQIDLFG